MGGEAASVAELKKAIEKLTTKPELSDTVFRVCYRNAINDALKLVGEFEAGVREREFSDKEIAFIADLVWVETDELTKPCYGLDIDEIEEVYQKLHRVMGGASARKVKP